MSAAACVIDSDAVPPDSDGVRRTLGARTGFETALEQSVIECETGGTVCRETGAADEVLFVLDGTGVLHADGEAHAVEPESGAYVGPGHEYVLECAGAGPLRIIAVRIPDPERALEEAPSPPAARVAVRRLGDQEAEAATTDREFRIVADPGCGLRSATHFVGYIPTKRAPDHFHTYDEVIYVLDGEGVLHTADGDSSLGPGSCIQLPARTVHCLENTGDDLMRVVAVFRPAGSPAAAYYPDGTPAYAGMPPVEAA
jgi:mannose-6-phosphate isomerase-like protein (cupin superfamily)